ncbi:hypothetical protein PIB30_060290 [Stylosanthes scabra]|uniref:Uncharacterized protein n=1 Tax=Stylosanthes scabra TaxID=79078 RepID=A0ABU6VMY6_9FABA|nr:hypothetical protein [Stylosanthes scabra]
MHNHLSHKSPTFCLGTSGCAGSSKIPRRYISYIGVVCGDSSLRNRLVITNQEQEDAVYTDNSNDDDVLQLQFPISIERELHRFDGHDRLL